MVLLIKLSHYFKHSQFEKREREAEARIESTVERFRGEILTTSKKIITEGWFISINGVLLLF